MIPIIALLKIKFNIVTIILILPLSIFSIYILVIAPITSRIIINDDIQIIIPPYVNETIKLEYIDSIYILNWKDNTDFTPVVRKPGISIGSYKAGRFNLMNGSSAIVLSSTSKVVAIKYNDKYALLAPNDFDDFFNNLAETYYRDINERR